MYEFKPESELCSHFYKVVVTNPKNEDEKVNIVIRSNTSVNVVLMAVTEANTRNYPMYVVDLNVSDVEFEKLGFKSTNSIWAGANYVNRLRFYEYKEVEETKVIRKTVRVDY